MEHGEVQRIDHAASAPNRSVNEVPVNRQAFREVKVREASRRPVVMAWSVGSDGGDRAWGMKGGPAGAQSVITDRLGAPGFPDRRGEPGGDGCAANGSSFSRWRSGAFEGRTSLATGQSAATIS